MKWCVSQTIVLSLSSTRNFTSEYTLSLEEQCEVQKEVKWQTFRYCERYSLREREGKTCDVILKPNVTFYDGLKQK
jgi:hypothetical protein